MRSALAAIDYNENIHRKIKLDSAGEPRYKMKVRVYSGIFIQLVIECYVTRSTELAPRL